MRTPIVLFTCVLGLLGCDSEATDNRLVGMNDTAATDSCDHAAQAPIRLTASLDSARAGDAVITVPGDETYLITLPEGGESYGVLRTTMMHTTVALFVRERDMIVHLDPDGIPSSLRHGVCPNTLIDDYRAHLHNPNDYRLTFSAEGPREILVVALAEQIGHDPDSDGGMHDHDGGEDHDGGHEEHDGGHDEDGGHGDDAG